MASPNLSEIVTTTLRNRSGTLADNVTRNNALLDRLKSAGAPVLSVVVAPSLKKSPMRTTARYKRYSGYEALNITPSDVFTAAEFAIRQAAVAISISGWRCCRTAARNRSLTYSAAVSTTPKSR
jgi:hypothetical protein